MLGTRALLNGTLGREAARERDRDRAEGEWYSDGGSYEDKHHRVISRSCAGLISAPGPPMTLGNAAAARVRLIVWCKACQHQVEPDPSEMAERYGADTAVLDWRDRLVCSQCGGRHIDMVVSGTEKNARATCGR